RTPHHGLSRRAQSWECSRQSSRQTIESRSRLTSSEMCDTLRYKWTLRAFFRRIATGGWETSGKKVKEESMDFKEVKTKYSVTLLLLQIALMGVLLSGCNTPENS